MMIMVPPQQGHGGRGSTGSSMAVSSGSGATTLEAATSVRNSSDFDPMIRTSVSATSTRCANVRR